MKLQALNRHFGQFNKYKKYSKYFLVYFLQHFSVYIVEKEFLDKYFDRNKIYT